MDGRQYTLTLDRRKKFWLYDMASSLAIIDNNDNWFYWEDDMLVLKFGDSDKVWYFQREPGWDIVKFREDLSTLEEGDPLPDGTVFERIM